MFRVVGSSAFYPVLASHTSQHYHRKTLIDQSISEVIGIWDEELVRKKIIFCWVKIYTWGKKDKKVSLLF